MNELIARLPEQVPLDIVGDIHGEISALDRLLQRLGYAGDGSHPDGRLLVFLGDLVDRGPDSPAVLQKVMALVQAGRARCVMGNHELNILRGETKHGNDWIMRPGAAGEDVRIIAGEAERRRYQAFFATLPLALERRDLRIVHACWHGPSIAALREHRPPVLEVYDEYARQTERRLARSGAAEAGRRAEAEYGERLRRPDWDATFLPAIAATEAGYQMGNPVRVVTSGVEVPISDVRQDWYRGEPPDHMAPFWAGGKWRMVSRLKWWERYQDDVPVVIGHYWRRFSEAHFIMSDKYGPDLFAGIKPHHWMGPRRNVYCVDFSVGMRPYARRNGKPTAMGQLAALRVPEWEVMHDGGDAWRLRQPGTH